MVTYLLKKSYLLKNFKETKFEDLWGDHGVFTTMWIYGSPPKILFFKDHIDNLIKSTKSYGILNRSIKSKILKLIKKNINVKKNYNHLLRVALNKNILSISLRKRVKPSINFNLKLVNLKRYKPEFKNLKYKEILKHLSKLDNSKSDIGLCSNKKIFETGTSNIFFIKNKKVFSPINKFYKGITFNFFRSKIKNIILKDIKVSSLKTYDEIILVGSGKGVTSVKTINQIKWKRKSLKFYNILSKYYSTAVNNYPRYKYTMKDPNNPCIFCNTKISGSDFENDLAYASYDTYPVSDHHCLIIPKRHVKDYFDLSNEELIACNDLIKIVKEEIISKDKNVKAFNIGTNIGKISGQSIMHCHIHLIPRRVGDVENPQGGVRGVIPSKQHYIRKIK